MTEQDRTIRPTDLKFATVANGDDEYSLEVHLTESAKESLANEIREDADGI